MHLLAWTWLDFWTNLLQVFLMLLGLFLILVVLLQRGRGGGLAGAFGGAGGQSAFGTKAGDVFTRITIGIAILWVVTSGVSGMLIRRTQSAISETLPEGEEDLPIISPDDEDGDGTGLGPIDLPDTGVNDEGADNADGEAADNDPNEDTPDDGPSNGEDPDDANTTDSPMEEEADPADPDDSTPVDNPESDQEEPSSETDEATDADQEEPSTDSENATETDPADTPSEDTGDSDEPADPPN